MAGMKVSELDFLQLLPAFMRDDEAVIAFSKSMNRLLGEPAKRLSTIRTWDKIDELNEAECDEMAWELDVDWYDSANMSLQEKQTAIKEAQLIKSKRGTKWAVQRLVTSLLGEGEIAEWYETGGEPYTFAIMITSTDSSAENYAKFMQAADIAKNERSHMVGIFYYWPQGPEHGIEYVPADRVHRYDFTKCGTRDRPAVLGCVLRHGVELKPADAFYTYDIPELNVDGVLATLGAPVVGTAIVGKSMLRS